MTRPPTPGPDARPIPGCHGYLATEDGHVIGRRARALSPYKVKGGYLRVNIIGRNRLVHVLVAATFLGPKPNGMQVNHKDGDKANNAAANLEYVTPSENVRHSIDVLRTERAPGEKNANAKLTDAIVRQIRERYVAGEPFAALAREFEINPTTAHRVATGRTWRHVPC